MIRLKKVAMAVSLLLTASCMLCGCSDDDFPENRFGAIGINSLQTTSTSVTIYWTVVSNGSCDGYKILINEGTRANKGAEVMNQQFGPKEHHNTFNGLRPNTSYVVTTQAIPSASSGRTEADTYEMEFMTAPLVSGVTVGNITLKDIPVVDANGNLSTKKVGSTKVSWTALTSNCGGYRVTLYGRAAGTTAWSVVSSNTITDPSVNSVDYTDVLTPAWEYRAGVSPRPNNACWYPSGEETYSSEVTAPAQ